MSTQAAQFVVPHSTCAANLIESPMTGVAGRIGVASEAESGMEADAGSPGRPLVGLDRHDPDPTFAAVDLGTNNCRLLIARRAGDGLRVVDAYSRIVRLGAGVAQSGVLSEAAMRRTVSTLAVCADKVRAAGVTHSRFVATEACRRASNAAEFVERVRAETGIELDIIPPEEEARLALAGCVPVLDPCSEHALVFDIGGGSTEIIWTKVAAGREPEMIGWTSIPCGVVTLAENHGGREPNADDYKAMVAEVGEHVDAFEQKYRPSRAFAAGTAQMVGISGTVTTVAAVLMDLPRYDRTRVDDTWIASADVASVTRGLAAMTYAQRMAHPCIRRGRADLVLPGCAALEAILSVWKAERVRVADRGLREGILRRLMGASTVVGSPVAA